MKKSRDPIPKPKSNFLLVKCPDCGEERIIFSSSTKDVGCRACGRKLSESKGGRSIVFGKILKKLD